MSTIIDCSESFRHKKEENKTIRDASEGIIGLLSRTDERVQEFLDAPVDSIVTVDELHLQMLVRDYFLFCLRKNNFEMTEEFYVVFFYMEQLIIDLIFMKSRWKEIIRSPHVTDWIEKEDYQTAGDTAIFGYLFSYKSRRNQLNKYDYLAYINGCYSIWYKRSVSFNTGRILSGGIPVFLPLIERMGQDLFRRGLRSL